MDLKDIKALYRFLKGTDIVELELEDKRGRVKLKRAGAAGEIAPVSFIPAPLPGDSAEVDKGKAEAKSNIKTITSPMVGTYYGAASPDVASFVEMGTQVKSGQVVCIIEAMKIMNEIDSDVTGKVVSILVENGQPVEYGEPLFNIEV
ncbi:Biotin carboxyl carrier protein of acetyl-CoA carboxylase [hydrothermal vent metagenome]|uniref:Biotin carboxyl carrier protein of acetyl-CoA carboxylase n=1 Tax=hydrothermal vent metagenome TaxID=652676 RepID=A0A3B0RH08_9ZZZZ